MEQIGTIQRLQIQTGRLKVGEAPNRRYDPAGILAVERLLLTPDGATGITANGDALVDIHNARHPDSRNNGDNPISIGFTAHYAAMRARFGAHLTDGIAGENLIIASERAYTLADFGGYLTIEHDGTPHRFRVLKIAAPCREFSTFCAGRPIDGADLKDALQFLHAGRRGFHFTPLDGGAITVAPGDKVYAGA